MFEIVSNLLFSPSFGLRQRSFHGAGHPVSVQDSATVDVTGRPSNYCLTGGEIEVYPTPSATFEASLVYYGRIAALSGTNTTNWLLSEAPDVYLYGALVHTAPYLKDDARMQVWEAFFKLGIDTLNGTSDDAKFGGTWLVMKTRRRA